MMMMINSTTTSSSSSEPPNFTPPNSDDQEMISQEIFRSSFQYSREQSPAGPPKMYPQTMNPRKKRTKLIRIDSTTASTSSNVAVTKPRYGKKPDPSAPKITRPCSECGKRFWSVKALFGHMRCHPERQWRGINPPPNFRRSSASDHQRDADDQYGFLHQDRSNTEEDYQVATCLLMLANSPPPPPPTTPTSVTTTNAVGYQGFLDSEVRDHQLALGCGDIDYPHMGHGAGPSNCRFECSSCKKVFGSHQALGGHRASHKNVKGCFAITKTEGAVTEEDYSIGDHDLRNVVDDGDCSDQDKCLMVLGHKCSICLKVFSSGQALGGHKRCHWEKGDEPSSLTQGGTGPNQSATKEGGGLDLNLPVPVEDDQSSSSFSSRLSLDLRLGL